MNAVAINSAAGLTSTAMEHHYSPDELAKLWNLSTDTVRRLFEREPGVLVIEQAKTRARRYRTLRIPESIAARVHRRLTNPLDNAQRFSIR
jgi:hypothetical protein